MTPKGLPLQRAESGKGIAAVASDARVALDIIFTGGTVGAPPPRFVGMEEGRRLVMPPVPDAAAVFGQTFMFQDVRRMAELTGGQATTLRRADYALNRLDQATRLQYLLGYYPTNPAWDGRYRQISVKVNRPGATVLYRRGYFASDRRASLDRKTFVTQDRIHAAGRYAGTLGDITVTLDPPVVVGPGEMRIQGTIRAPRAGFVQAEGRQAATFDLVVYCRGAGHRRNTQDRRSEAERCQPRVVHARRRPVQRQDRVHRQAGLRQGRGLRLRVGSAGKHDHEGEEVADAAIKLK